MQAAERLEKIVHEVPVLLTRITETQASLKPDPTKWSIKEILGHLVDSAANNHQRFVRMQIENNLSLLQYKQNEWIAVQQYQEKQWIELILLWEVYNRHLVHVLQHVNRDTLTNTGNFPDYGTQTLQFIMDDYVDHMEHHLKQIAHLNGQ